MANSNKPFGFKLVGTLTGHPMNGAIKKYFVPADNTTAIYIGDTVTMAASSDAQVLYSQDAFYPEAAVGAATSLVLGVCVGVEPSFPDLTVNYRKASTAMYIYVHTDPNAIYSVQGDGTAFTVADVGLNATITATAGSTVTGMSKFVITSASASTAKGVLIVGIDPDPNNEVGAFMKFLVKLNLHQFGTAIIGIS